MAPIARFLLRFSSVVLASLLAFLPASAQAVPRDIDATFGTAGKTTQGFIGATKLYSLAIQPDGKILAAGQPAIVRLNPDGSLDSSFASLGVMENGLKNTSVVHTGGKIVAASVLSSLYLIKRYNDDGGLDSTFASGGTYSIPTAGPTRLIVLAAQADGKIVIAFVDGDPQPDGIVGIGRLNADGSFDSGFNGGAPQFLSAGGGVNSVNAVHIQSDGKILVAGQSGSTFYVTRLTAAGAFDATWTLSGIALSAGVTAIEPEDAMGLGVSGGSVYLAASVNPGFGYSQGGSVLRFTDGIHDGTVTVGAPLALVGKSLATDGAGKILMGGARYTPPGYVTTWRYNADLSPDLAFGGGSDNQTDFDGTEGIVYGIAVKANGRIVTGASKANAFVFMQYMGELNLSPSTTTLTAAPPGATNQGQALTLTATITGGTVTGGTVQFRDGGNAIAGCEAVTITSNAADCPTSSLPPGARALSAHFTGDTGLSASDSAAIVHSVRYLWNVVLDGAQETPPNPSPALGFGTVTVDVVANELAYSIAYSGLGSAETAAHIHGFSARGVPSGVVHPLAAGSPKVGVWNYLEGQEADILAGLTYFNIHTSGFPGGEIRGQIDAGPPQALNVSVGGGGTGNVTGTGIACPGDCTEVYPAGTVVSLTATATGNSYFSGWGGDCSGTGSCNVTMNGTRNVSATFLPGPGANNRLYRLGEDDINAFVGAPGDNPTKEAGLYGPAALGKFGAPTYVQGAGGPGSLAMHFAVPNDGYSTSTDLASTATDNFGLEAWVKSDGSTAGGAGIAYVGHSGTSGFGLIRNGADFAGLYGGVIVFGSTPVGAPGRWVHLAIVRDGGTSRMYVNGVQAGADEPNGPAQAVGHTFISRNPASGADVFDGAIDHVRFFTHGGGFSTTGLNVRSYQAQRMGTGTGSLAADAGALDCTAPTCVGHVPTGTTVTLTATPNPGSSLGPWSGCDSNPTPNTCVVSVVTTANVMVPFDLAATVKKPRDADGSGSTDIFWRDPDGQAALWLMSGTDVAGSALLLGPSTGWTAEFTGDFNNDGRADIVWKHAASGMWAMWLLNGTNVIDSGLILGPSTGWNVTHVGDLNNDGRSDLVWKHTDGNVAAWLMNGLGVSDSGVLFGPNPDWSVTHLADLDGNGTSDLVFRNLDGSVTGWLMNGLAVTDSAYLFGPGSSWQVVRTGNFDAGPTTDLLWRDGGGQLAIWLMNGLAPTQTGIVFNGGAFDVTHVADFDGDGKSDLLFADGGGQVSMWMMDGLAVMSSGIVFGGGGGWAVTHTGDFNNDGRYDLQWKDSAGQVAIWTMNGLSVIGSAVIFGGNGGWVSTP